MKTIEEKFAKLGTDNAPGQEVRQGIDDYQGQLRGNSLPGIPVDLEVAPQI